MENNHDPRPKAVDRVSDLAAAWARLPWYTRAWLYALDRSINALAGGDPRLTVSESLALKREEGAWEGVLGCNMLDRADPGHCDRALVSAKRKILGY